MRPAFFRPSFSLAEAKLSQYSAVDLLEKRAKQMGTLHVATLVVHIFGLRRSVCLKVTSTNQLHENHVLNVRGSMSTHEGIGKELYIVMLGSPQKSILFEKLCQAASKYERHVHYHDVHYLTVDYNGKQELLEFTDPGLARTGGRELAIKRADLALLFYSALSINSLQNLQALKDDLEMKSNLPLRLLCDSDEVMEYDEDGGSTGISSMSEGYESEPEREGKLRRQNSMDKIRNAHEDGGLAVEQGQQWAKDLGQCCEFMLLSSSQFSDAKTFLEGLICTIRANQKTSSRSIVKRLRSLSISSPSKRSEDSKESPKTCSVDSAANENKSKVCSIM